MQDRSFDLASHRRPSLYIPLISLSISHPNSSMVEQENTNNLTIKVKNLSHHFPSLDMIEKPHNAKVNQIQKISLPFYLTSPQSKK